MGGMCIHKNETTGAPAIELIQHRNGNQVWRCRWCLKEWPLPFQIQKLPQTPILPKE